MKTFDTFSPLHFVPDPKMKESVENHRRVMGETKLFTILRQVKKASVKSTYPAGWRYK